MENNYTYEIIEDGYYILNNDKRIIEQRGNFADVVLPGKSYEENAKAHIAQLVESENTANTQADEYEQLKQTVSLLDSAFEELMIEILPSLETEV